MSTIKRKAGTVDTQDLDLIPDQFQLNSRRHAVIERLELKTRQANVGDLLKELCELHNMRS